MMATVTISSQFLQTENMDFALVRDKLDLTISDLQEMKTMNSPNMDALQQDLQAIFTKASIILSHQPSILNISASCLSINWRTIYASFPVTSLLVSFGVLSLLTISILRSEELKSFGSEQLELTVARSRPTAGRRIVWNTTRQAHP